MAARRAFWKWRSAIHFHGSENGNTLVHAFLDDIVSWRVRSGNKWKDGSMEINHGKT